MPAPAPRRSLRLRVLSQRQLQQYARRHCAFVPRWRTVVSQGPLDSMSLDVALLAWDERHTSAGLYGAVAVAGAAAAAAARGDVVAVPDAELLQRWAAYVARRRSATACCCFGGGGGVCVWGGTPG